MGRFISDTFKAVSAVRTVRQNQTRAQIETAWEKKKTLQFSIFCNTLALIMCRPHMLVELSYCSKKKKNADSLQIWCHGGFIYCMSRRFGEKNPVPLSPWFPGIPGVPGKPVRPGCPCSPRLPGSPGGPAGPGGPGRLFSGLGGIWLINTSILLIWPFREKQSNFGWDQCLTRRNGKLFFFFFFYAKGKFELTVNELFTNLSGDGAHHALRRKVSLETKTFFLRRMKNKYRCVVSHSVEVEYKHHVGLSQFVDAH